MGWTVYRQTNALNRSGELRLVCRHTQGDTHAQQTWNIKCKLNLPSVIPPNNILQCTDTYTNTQTATERERGSPMKHERHTRCGPLFFHSTVTLVVQRYHHRHLLAPKTTLMLCTKAFAKCSSTLVFAFNLPPPVHYRSSPAVPPILTPCCTSTLAASQPEITYCYLAA